MDISKYKEALQKISFLKDYSALLVPVVIGLIAVVLLILSPLMSGKLVGQITRESISMGKRLRSLSNDVVSRNQWEVAQQYQKDYGRDANQIALLTKQSTQRQLLSYEIFPEPKDTSVLIFEQFSRRYRDALEKLIVRMNALDCPTDVELDRSLRRLKPGGRRSMKNSPIELMMFSLPGTSARSGGVEAKITDILCREKAESASVYANATGLIGYKFWEEYKYTGMKEDVENCWYWQLAYWIVEDVVDTIRSLNSGSNTVYTSPVKRLLGVSFVKEEGGLRRRTAGKKCSYVRSMEEELTTSFTGRVCNDDIDVVHFNVTVVVSAKAVLPFMKELCSGKQHKFNGYFGHDDEQIFEHNQITILEYDVASIDRQDMDHNLYRYGEDAVVKLNVVCEYIFAKNGYDVIKPESVKESLKEASGTGR